MPKSKRRKQPRSGSGGAPARASAQRMLAQSAANWPVYECLASRDWQNTEDLTQIVVARRNPLSGKVVAAVFLVDLGCLGVKSALLAQFDSMREYRDVLEGDLLLVQAFAPISLDLTAKIVQEGVAYANTLGFPPHRDYFDALPLLHGAQPNNAPDEVPHGRDGRPLYLSGPDDNPAKIVRQLERAVGPGNFEYTVYVLPGAPLPHGIDPAHVEPIGPDDGEIETERLSWLPSEAIEALNDEDLTAEQGQAILAPYWPAAVAREFVALAPPEVSEELANTPPDQLAPRLRPLLPDELRALFDGLLNARPDSIEEYLELLDGIAEIEADDEIPPELQALLQSDDPQATAAIDAFMVGQLVDALEGTLPHSTLERIRALPLAQGIPQLLDVMPDDLRATVAPQLNLALERLQQRG
jgi:hypothetical protein